MVCNLNSDIRSCVWEYKVSRREPHYVTHCMTVLAALLICFSVMDVRGQSPRDRSVLQRPSVHIDLGAESQADNHRELRPLRLPAVAGQVAALRPAPQISLNAPEAVQPAMPPRSVSTRSELPISGGIKPRSDLGVDITIPVALDTDNRPLPMPLDYSQELGQRQPGPRRDPQPELLWLSDQAYGASLNFCYQPLYFEETNLERYGETVGGLQPLVSAAHFYGSAALLPFRLINQPPHCCIYNAHQYRPGGPRACSCQWIGGECQLAGCECKRSRSRRDNEKSCGCD